MSPSIPSILLVSFRIPSNVFLINAKKRGDGKRTKPLKAMLNSSSSVSRSSGTGSTNPSPPTAEGGNPIDSGETRVQSALEASNGKIKLGEHKTSTLDKSQLNEKQVGWKITKDDHRKFFLRSSFIKYMDARYSKNSDKSPRIIL